MGYAMTVDLDDPFLTVKQVAEIFNMKPYAIRVWLKEGKLKGVKFDAQWRIQKSVVVQFAQAAYGDGEEK